MKNPFGSNLRFLRELKSWSLADLGQHTQLDATSLAMLESGSLDPSLDELVRISAVLNYPLDPLLKKDLKDWYEHFQRREIKLLVLDVDGVLTDGGMYFTESGDEMKRYNTKDGRGIMSCRKAGIEVAFLSGGVKLEVIRSRAERLGVERVYVGLEKKMGILDGWREELGIEWSEIAYVGDDVNDLAVMERVGLSGCPADATDRIKQVADFVLERPGGMGCVREFVERFLVEEVS